MSSNHNYSWGQFKVDIDSQPKPKIFVSRIPPQAKRKELREYLLQFGDICIKKFANKVKSRAPKISEVEVTSLQTFNRILGVKRHFLPCGAEIKIEKLLDGKDLKKKMSGECKRKITVFGLPGWITKLRIKQIFEKKFGKVDFCYIKRKLNEGACSQEPTSYAFVAFFDEKIALEAIRTERLMVEGYPTRIRKFVPSENKLKKQRGKCEETLYTKKTAYTANQTRNFGGKSLQNIYRNYNKQKATTIPVPVQGPQQCQKLLAHLPERSFEGGMARIGFSKFMAPFKFLSFLSESCYCEALMNREAYQKTERLRISFNDYKPQYDEGLNTLQCASRISRFAEYNHQGENLIYNRGGVNKY